LVDGCSGPRRLTKALCLAALRCLLARLEVNSRTTVRPSKYLFLPQALTSRHVTYFTAGFTNSNTFSNLFFLCSVLCCACRYRVQHKLTHLSTPVFPMQTPCQLAHWHTCCTSCKTRATSHVGTDVAPLQNPCQLWTWHECCTPCKTRANFGHARVVPQVIHRLSTGCPMQNPCQLCALARLVPTLDMQKSCQCWAGGGGCALVIIVVATQAQKR